MLSRIGASIRRRLSRGSFAAQVAVLSGGTLGAQVISALAAPILTRLYSPDEFGLLSVFAALLAVLGVISSLRYEMAIPLPKTNVEAANVAALCLLIVGVIGVVSAFALWIGGGVLLDILNAPALTPYIWLLPVGVVSAGLYRVLQTWSVRRSRFNIIAKTKWKQSLAMILIQVFGYGFGPIALIVGQVAGQGAGLTSLFVAAKDDIRRSRPSWRKVAFAVRRYRRFPLFDAWYGLFNAASLQLVPLLFAVYFGAAAAGLYALSQRVLGTPIGLIGSAVASVFFSRASEARRAGTLGALVHKIYSLMATVSMPGTVALALTAPELFSIVFGDEWRMAGEIARWMTPWLFIVFVTSPISTLYAILERQPAGAAFQGAIFVVRLLAIYLGAQTGSLVIASAMFSGASFLMFSGFLVWAYRATGFRVLALFTATGKAALLALLVNVPLIAAYLFDAEAIGRALAFGVASMLYAAMLLLELRRQT